MIRLGVDAITTDNLALMALFGGQRREESSLDPAGATPEPGDQGHYKRDEEAGLDQFRIIEAGR